MAENKFYTPEMELSSLLEGRHWDDTFPEPKVKPFDPIYGPTPFPVQEKEYIVGFQQQHCLRCGQDTFSYSGIFEAFEKGSLLCFTRCLNDKQSVSGKEVITTLETELCYKCA